MEIYKNIPMDWKEVVKRLSELKGYTHINSVDMIYTRLLLASDGDLEKANKIVEKTINSNSKKGAGLARI